MTPCSSWRWYLRLLLANCEITSHHPDAVTANSNSVHLNNHSAVDPANAASPTRAAMAGERNRQPFLLSHMEVQIPTCNFLACRDSWDDLSKAARWLRQPNGYGKDLDEAFQTFGAQSWQLGDGTSPTHTQKEYFFPRTSCEAPVGKIYYFIMGSRSGAVHGWSP